MVYINFFYLSRKILNVKRKGVGCQTFSSISKFKGAVYLNKSQLQKFKCIGIV